MVSVQQSRFALLKIEDDGDDGFSGKKSQTNKQNETQSSSSKKKNKKKNKPKDDTQELRNIAFGGGASGKSKPKPRPKSAAGNKPGEKGATGEWDQWVKRDSELTSDFYEKDLQQAILESKLQFEEQKTQAPGVTTNGNGKGKKKKKNTRPPPMTLEEFQKMREEEQQRKGSSDEEEEAAAPAPAQFEFATEVFNPDSKYFSGVSEEVLKILRKEKIQETYKKQYVADTARAQKQQGEIEKRDRELVQLQLDNQALKDDLKQVKKRNLQLCHILSQGEIKDKSKILLELEELKQLHDELTQEVQRLHGELQKERSKPKQADGSSGKGKGGKK